MSKRHPTPRLTLENILRILETALPVLQESHRVKSLGVFGSYARGDTKHKSDLDPLV